MKTSEKNALKVLEDAFTNDNLYIYVFEIQDYYADETDQLAEDNPEMEDYLNDIIPEFTESYNDTQRDEWLYKLRKIVNKAKTFIHE